jgi:uncharacterized protein DUF4157
MGDTTSAAGRREPAELTRQRGDLAAERAGHDPADPVRPAASADRLHRYLGNLGVQQLAGGGDALERAADEVALHHALPLAQERGWFAPVEGLGADGQSVDHARRAVGERLGADLRDVDVAQGPLAGAPAGALASAVSRVVHVAPAAFQPRTPIGQALLAHELTHVVQQSADTALPGGPSPAHADRARSVGTAPPGMAQHSISCSSCEQPAPAPVAATTFTDVQRTYRTTPDLAACAAALNLGIATARANASRLYRNADKPPVSTIREQYERETGTTVSYKNPFIGVSQDHVERAYRAWAENPTASTEPWVLLAVWVKEGLTEPTTERENAAGIPATSAADARAIYRSMAYYWNFGADVYTAHTAHAVGDNTADFGPGTGAAHDTAFRAQVARQFAAGRLLRDVSADIDAALTVTSIGAGRYRITASPRFAELSLLLVDAFYREQRGALAADPRVGANPDPGLVYMRWNMKLSSFNDFLNRAPNPDVGGAIPSKTDWAFHRPIAETEYGQSRRNAMRFKYLLEVFRHAYEDQP